MHEGDRYFERCYGADFDARISPELAEACWQAWIAHYTKHQPAHRVDYALRRIEALQNGEPPPSLPELPSAGAGNAELASGVDAAVAIVGAPGMSESPVADDAGEVPNGCLRACSDYEARCRADCPDAGGECELGCGREREVCLHGCY